MLQGPIPKIMILVLIAFISSFLGYQLARYYATTPELALSQKIVNLLSIIAPSELPTNVNLQFNNSKAVISLLYKCTSETEDKIIYLIRQWSRNFESGEYRNTYISESGDLIDSFYVPPYTKVAPAQMPLKDCVVIRKNVPSWIDAGPMDWFASPQKN